MYLFIIHSPNTPKCKISCREIENMEEGNVNVNARWIMPPKGMLKCNVRSFFSPEPLPDDNHTGIEVLFRNSMGIILHITAGSLGFEDQMENQFNALINGRYEGGFLQGLH